MTIQAKLPEHSETSLYMFTHLISDLELPKLLIRSTTLTRILHYSSLTLDMSQSLLLLVFCIRIHPDTHPSYLISGSKSQIIDQIHWHSNLGIFGQVDLVPSIDLTEGHQQDLHKQTYWGRVIILTNYWVVEQQIILKVEQRIPLFLPKVEQRILGCSEGE